MKGLTGILTGIATMAALGSSLEVKAAEEDRKFTIDLSYGYFIPKGEEGNSNGQRELGDFYGPSGLLEGKVIWHGLSPEVGISMGTNYYRADGSSTTETRRSLFGGNRLLYSDTAELTRIGIPIGVRAIPHPSFYLEGGILFVNLNETATLFNSDGYRELTEIDKNNRFGQGFYGEVGFRIPIADGDQKDTCIVLKLKADDVKIINGSEKPNVGGYSISIGLEFDGH